MNKILLVFLLLLASTRVCASHMAGAEIRYEYNGTNYTVYLTINTECGGPGGGAGSINISSVSTSTNFNAACTLVSSTVTPACPTMLTTCQNSSAILPGFTTSVYTATVTLAPATDWVISYYSSARPGSIANLANPTSSNLYVEARLNNSSAINSNPVVSGHMSYMGVVGMPLHIPLQAADAEADSVAYELVTPMHSASVNCTWGSGYSLTNILGSSGVCTVNNTTKMLTMQAAALGVYAIAIKVKEYRNSALVGSYIRDFIYMPLNGSTNITVPTPPANMTAFTCPGQANSITLNFSDAGGDSVFVNAITPTMAGWTFTKTYTSAPGNGSVNLSWTTPASLNPATLPYFYAHISAADNACPKSVMNYVFVVRTQQCMADSVWPGDANGDFTVNMYDPLHIAIAMGKTGASRAGATTSWAAQPCMPWANSFITNNVNMKHADCDGNGVVNSTDLASVTANYGLTHPKGEYHNKVTGAPPLYLDLTGITLKPGTAVTIPIKLGDATTPMPNIYGLATRITVNGTTMNSPSVTTATTWLGNSSNTINFTKTFPAKVEWAHVRNDHAEVNGNGTIGTLNFTVPANATPGATVTFTFGSTRIIDKDGIDITAFDEQDATTTIPVHVSDIAQGTGFAAIIPNPSHSSASLQLSLAEGAGVEVRVVDITGKLVWKISEKREAGESAIQLPAALTSGMYLVTVAAEGQPATQLKWIKQ